MRPALLSAALTAATLSAQINYNGTSIGVTPLTDLPPSTYLGFEAGLDPGGANSVPPDHLQAGLQRTQQIVPRDAAGNPDPAGKIVLISVGMSNTAQELTTFVRQSGQDARRVADPNTDYWSPLDQRLAESLRFAIQ